MILGEAMSYSVIPQVFFIIVTCVGYVFLSVKARFGHKEKSFNNTCSILLVIYVTSLLYLALLGRSGEYIRSLTLMPFSSHLFVLKNYNYHDVFYQIIENILVFIPMGILAPEVLNLRGKKGALPLTVLLGGLTSFIIELAQFTYAVGYSEVDDIINNTLGCAVGYGIFCFADYVKIQKNGIRITQGWLNGILPVILVFGGIILMALYRELILK